MSASRDLDLCILEVLLALAERLTGCRVEATVTIAPGETVQVTASGRVRFFEPENTPSAVADPTVDRREFATSAAS